ncbi:actin maturation protease-like isoform X1 [Argiope bruennichi]|uniref:actin maturation protease-like isoform X1 n=1 Tax=Argiope bruennichi TaxID=94029 RepID=UPI00249558B7|nr:actin maturation protease-like isoform X1 [Argiope bruennichi]
MQNKTGMKSDMFTSMSPPLPPPPPPPPLSNLNSKTSKIVAASTPATSEHSNSSFRKISRNIKYLFEDIDTSIVTFFKPLVPVIQDGPCCGIVALSMASQFFSKNIDADKILATAKNSKFTNKGEMFSTYNMATLSTTMLDCEACIVSNLFQHKSDILKSLANGWPVLIPYDADKNHEPCLNKGHNAHWAVLCGLCFSVSQNANYLLDGYSATDEIPYLYNLSSSLLIEKLLNFATKVCVYAYQGKSKHLALWNFDSLLLSNNNLYEATNKYNIEDMVIPNTGLSELNDKAVILKERDINEEKISLCE